MASHDPLGSAADETASVRRAMADNEASDRPLPQSSARVMISYSRRDSDLVDRLERDLHAAGFPVWVDRRDIEGGDEWSKEIHRAIDDASVILVVLSPAAVASPWVRREYRYALKQGKVVIPLLYHPSPQIPRELERLQKIDFLAGISFEATYPGQLAALVQALTGYESLDESARPVPARGGRWWLARLGIGSERAPLRRKDRQRFLTKVRSRYTHRLDDALQGAVLLDLGLREQPQAVMQQATVARETGELEQERPLPQGTSIAQVYDGAEGQLLILGEPGSGKTTLLLHLGLDLAQRARSDESLPVPVVFSLAAWALERRPLASWMIEELVATYQAPRVIARAWVERDEILPLLDGLDEVEEAHRVACAEAINAYHREHGLLPLVVCSRAAEYRALGARLALQGAVMVQPLSDEQIETYLARGGEPLSAVLAVVRQDAGVRELVATPLMLSVVALAYQGQPSGALPQAGDREAWRQAVFRDYVTRMLARRRSSRVSYPAEQTVRWLIWLAAQMGTRGQTDFYLERLQPDWLPDERARARYRRGARLRYGLPTSVLGGLLFGLAFSFLLGAGSSPRPDDLLLLLSGIISGLLFGVLMAYLTMVRGGGVTGAIVGLLLELPGTFLMAWDGGESPFLDFRVFISNALVLGALWVPVSLVAGAAVGAVIGKPTDRITPTEAVYWSWRGLLRGLLLGSLVGLCAGLLIGLLLGTAEGVIYPHGFPWQTAPLYALRVAVDVALPLILFLALTGGMFLGLSQRQMDPQDIQRPNEGIRRSAANSLRLFLLVGLVCSVSIFLIIVVSVASYEILGVGVAGTSSGFESIEWTTALGDGLGGALQYGLPIGVPLGLLIGLLTGLRGTRAYIQHRVLRHELQRAGAVPPHYERFLDFAADHVLLQRVGGGYRFIHALLLDYFASLRPEGTAELAG